MKPKIIKVGIPELIQISRLWRNDGKKLYPKSTVLEVDPLDIINNIYRTKIHFNDQSMPDKYLPILKALKTVGWDPKRPGIIGIGNNGEMWIQNGNHRTSLIANYELYTTTKICIRPAYHLNYRGGLKNRHTKSSRLTCNGQPFYPYGLLPKWNRRSIWHSKNLTL